MIKRLLLTLAFAAGLTASANAQAGAIYADGVLQPDLQTAFDRVNPGGIIRLEPGMYHEGATLKKGKDGVLIIGAPGVIFDGASVGGKATFVIQSDGITIDSIECKNVAVRSRNGACVRLESGDLTLRKVNFSHNENGILTWDRANKILIEDSIFEGNGKAGRAHGVYVSGAQQVIVRRTRIIGSHDHGHGLKIRAKYILVENSVVASLEGNDSYLIDIPNGGRAIVRNSLLVEGANTENWFILSFGVEGTRFEKNSLRLEKNIIVSDREGGSKFINLLEGLAGPELAGNVIVGDIEYDWSGSNYFFDSRGDLNWPDAPELPKVDLTQRSR
ncbi:MAG: hypothetical protein JJ850_00035 [Kordiimonadaceae bacterium]|nr:hypothetical protein [Kordiimonadaceae bacterium]MBO6567813.1 hypothetical protein [Kordiimonadaceae bacterium]MBO6962972.1 hypothetical protein [Kordiimonadaceae bacterium]